MKKHLYALFDEFIYESQYTRRVRAATLKGYRNSFTLFMQLVPHANVENLHSSTVTAFFKILQERKRYVGKGIPKTGVKKSTIATYWSKLNTFFGWLALKKYIPVNPFAGLAYPSPSYEDKKFLRKEDIEKIITAIHTHHGKNLLLLKRNLAIFSILLFCGLRREELLHLQIRDIDFERKILTVRADTSKSGRSRQLPLHSSIALYLKDYLSARKHYTTPYVLASSIRDAKLTEDGLKHWVVKLKDWSGVSFHLHQFRHTFAVNFLNSSNNIAKLRQLMGHKNISMTITYLRCLPVDAMRDDIETMSVDGML